MADNEKTSTEKMKEKFADKTLDAAQLEDVAGGNITEMQADANVLIALGIQLTSASPEALKMAYAKVGVKCGADGTCINSYFDKKTGKKITQQMAWKMAMDYATKNNLV